MLIALAEGGILVGMRRAVESARGRNRAWWAAAAGAALLLSALTARGGEAEADFAAAWQRATAALPALADYRPLELGAVPLPALLAWVPADGSALVYDSRCRPIRVRRDNDALVGRTEVKTTVTGGVKRVESRTVRFGRSIDLLVPGWTSYERDAAGRWVESGGGGRSELESRPGTLSRVTDQAAWYAGFLVELELACNRPLEVTSPCRQGGERTCRRCRALGVRARSVSPGFGVGSGHAGPQRIRTSEPVDCSGPCPPDPTAATRARLAPLLQGRTFLTVPGDDQPPALFRSREACRRWRTRRRED